MKATPDEAAQALQDYTRGEIRDMVHVSFPCFIVEHLGPIPMPDGSEPRGVAVGRAIVQPVQRVMWHGNTEMSLPRLINIPAPPNQRGPFAMFGAFDKGQRVFVTVSEVALDFLIEGGESSPTPAGTTFETQTRHPGYPRFLSMTDAWISGNAYRTDSDPEFPKEYLNDFGFMLLDDEKQPLSKFIMRRNGQIRVECEHFYVRAKQVDWFELGGGPVPHGPTSPHHPKGSGNIKSMFSKDETKFEPGNLTGPEETDPSTDPKAEG